MKHIRLKSGCTLLVILILFSFLPSGSFSASSVNTAPQSVFQSFGKDPAAERNFSWFTSGALRAEYLEYCDEASFRGFGENGITRVKAQSHETKTDTDTRTIHRVTLQGLKPDTKYYYRVGSSKDGYSLTGIFQTASKAPESFTFITLTDTQGDGARDYNVWKNTLDTALKKFHTAKFLMHTGDMEDNGQKISQWDLFANAVQEEMLDLPIEPVVGNHDALNANHTNPDNKNFTERFNLPSEEETGAPAGTVYSFDYGDAHFAVMNTQCGSKNLKKQAEWLKKDMENSSRTWKIVALHRGPYGATYDTTDIRSAWAPVFDQTGVDLVFEGHDHNYVRSYPMKNKTKVKPGEGTVYIATNSGGVKFYPLKARSWQEVDLQPKTQVYAAVTVEKKQLKLEAYDVKGNLLDYLLLKK